jgi:CheY-like chemotaxis protein
VLSSATIPIDILLVEDSPSDVVLTREALRESRIANDLTVVRDGEQALAYLRRQPPYEDATRPDLVLLDLNLPNLDGRDVLRAVRADENLATLPIIVLTTSDADADIRAAYASHANSYVQKPVNMDRFVDVIRAIEGFWFTVVKLPPR